MIAKASDIRARLAKHRCKLFHKGHSGVSRKVDLQEGRAGRDFHPNTAIALRDNRGLANEKSAILHAPTSLLVEGGAYRAGVTERVLPLTFSEFANSLNAQVVKVIHKPGDNEQRRVARKRDFGLVLAAIKADAECIEVISLDNWAVFNEQDAGQRNSLCFNFSAGILTLQPKVERDDAHESELISSKVRRRLLGLLQNDGLRVHFASHASKLGRVHPQLRRLSNLLLPHCASVRAGQVNHIHRQSPLSALTIARGGGVVIRKEGPNK